MISASAGSLEMEQLLSTSTVSFTMRFTEFDLRAAMESMDWVTSNMLPFVDA